ncbi:hypothetical protein DL768_005293 [Monosporascus sp. mg162]|nr:hypothetical protein DL768_005293 [Monosporascus sp. mg162]
MHSPHLTLNPLTPLSLRAENEPSSPSRNVLSPTLSDGAGAHVVGIDPDGGGLFIVAAAALLLQDLPWRSIAMSLSLISDPILTESPFSRPSARFDLIKRGHENSTPLGTPTSVWLRLLEMPLQYALLSPSVGLGHRLLSTLGIAPIAIVQSLLPPFTTGDRGLCRPGCGPRARYGGGRAEPQADPPGLLFVGRGVPASVGARRGAVQHIREQPRRAAVPGGGGGDDVSAVGADALFPLVCWWWASRRNGAAAAAAQRRRGRRAVSSGHGDRAGGGAAAQGVQGAAGERGERSARRGVAAWRWACGRAGTRARAP